MMASMGNGSIEVVLPDDVGLAGSWRALLDLGAGQLFLFLRCIASILVAWTACANVCGAYGIRLGIEPIKREAGW